MTNAMPRTRRHALIVATLLPVLFSAVFVRPVRADAPHYGLYTIDLAGYALGCGLVSRSAMLPCLAATFVATKCESLIGAIAQDRFALLTNEVVNFINTLIGATLAIALGGPMGAL